MRVRFLLLTPVLVAACAFRPTSEPGATDAPSPGDDGSLAIDGMPDIDGTPQAAPCASPIADEPFTDPTPCAPWAGRFGDNITQGTGSLDFAPTANVSSSAGCTGTQFRALPPNGVIVEVPQVASGGGTFTQLQVLKTESVSIGVNGTELRYAENAGLPIYNTIDYSPTIMRWWRLRPDLGAIPAIIAEYSADGLAWTQLGSHPTALEDMRVQVIAGSSGGPASGSSKFTRLVMCP